MKRRTVNGDEQDAVSRWARKYLCCLQRAGVVSKTKRRIRRRERREAKSELRDAGEWGRSQTRP